MSSLPASATVQLSRGGADDLDSVIAIMNAAFDAHYGEAWTRSQCAGILPMTGVELVLARVDGGATAGFSLHRTIAGESELLLIAVAPPHRRRGVGQLLLDDFIGHARSCGAKRVHLEVRDGNPAVAMYRAAGFSTAGRRRKYYRGKNGDEFDALTLSKPI